MICQPLLYLTSKRILSKIIKNVNNGDCDAAVSESGLQSQCQH